MELPKKIAESGSKAYQREEDEEWRVKAYSHWHRTLGKGCYTLDVDFIEWRFDGNYMYAVGVMEVTRVDQDKQVDAHYLESLRMRFEDRDLQGRAAVTVARALHTHAYLVLFRADCSEFWVRDLTDRTAWKHYDEPAMRKFIQEL